MNWEDKVKLVTALNDGRYEDAVEMMRLESDWDAQCMDMFITGFDLALFDVCMPIKERIMKTNCNDVSSFIGSFRWTTLQKRFEQVDNNSNKEDEQCSTE